MQFIDLLQPDSDFVLHSADFLYFSLVHSTLVCYTAEHLQYYVLCSYRTDTLAIRQQLDATRTHSLL